MQRPNFAIRVVGTGQELAIVKANNTSHALSVYAKAHGIEAEPKRTTLGYRLHSGVKGFLLMAGETQREPYDASV